MIYCVHVDHLKRPIVMSDATKAMVWQAKWLPFGAASSLNGTASLDAHFPGQWFQIESGLHYNWNYGDSALNCLCAALAWARVCRA